MKKKLFTLLTVITMTIGSMSSVYAATNTDGLTPEQKAVIDSYETTEVSSVEDLKSLAGRSASSKTSWTGTFHRGSALMWSDDCVYWEVSGGKITSSKAWQDVGYIFPNIARAKGIKKISSSTASVTYRAKKTIGAGVVTPWGDVTVYESDYTDFLRVNANGAIDAWQ